MRIRIQSRIFPALLAAVAALPAAAASPNASLDATLPATEHVTLRNGFDLDCVRHETVGENMRLYISEGNSIDIAATQIVRIEIQPANTQVVAAPAVSAMQAERSTSTVAVAKPMQVTLTQDDLHPLLAAAGSAHNIDADLLWSVVKAESAGNPRAVSRAGAQGLMQLMPATASTLGVTNSFAPQQNIAGGAAYLDQMLTRYHDSLPLALAAYNAGPDAVDRYHGIPPYRETKIYVARVIAEFNRRKAAARVAQHESAASTAPQISAVKSSN